MASSLFPQSAKTLTKSYYKQGKFFFPSVAIACDHGGEALKQTLVEQLKKTGFFQDHVVLWQGEGQQKDPFSLKNSNGSGISLNGNFLESPEGKTSQNSSENQDKKTPQNNPEQNNSYDLFILEFSKKSQAIIVENQRENHHEESQEIQQKDTSFEENGQKNHQDKESLSPLGHNPQNSQDGLFMEKSMDVPLENEGEKIHYPHCLPFMLQKVNEGSLGVLICTSGVGMAMAANRFPGIRAALCAEESMAYLARSHNNANILVLGAEFISNSDALNCLKIFLTTPFSGGRHEVRLNLIETYARLYKEEKDHQKKIHHGGDLKNSNGLSPGQKTITILGAGAWGKALGKSLESKGLSVMYWNRPCDTLEQENPYGKPVENQISHESQNTVNHGGLNKKNQKNFSLPYGHGIPHQRHYMPQEEDDFLKERQEKGLYTENLRQALVYSSYCLIGVSAQAVPCLCEQIKASGLMPKGIVLCSKGLEEKTGKTMGAIASEILETPMIGVVSGPNLAKEVFQGLPCGLTLGSQQKDMLDFMKELFTGTSFILESTTDTVGLQLAGALKNVFAIGYGFVQGFWTNENLWATYLTLATKELGRLIIAFGGQGATLLTYGGLGDLFLTCTSLKGRNSSFGRLLAHQWKTKGFMDLCPSTLVEGLHTLPGLLRACKEKNIHTPLLEEFHKVLGGQQTPDEWQQKW